MTSSVITSHLFAKVDEGIPRPFLNLPGLDKTTTIDKDSSIVNRPLELYLQRDIVFSTFEISEETRPIKELIQSSSRV